MSVEEMSINGDEPLPEYIVEQGIFGAIDSSPSLGQIPIFDINFFSSTSLNSKQAKNELEKLRSALSSSGCFQAVGHGISSSFLDKVREAGTQFFALPVDEKQKYLEAAHVAGNDVKVTEKQVLDWCYRLTLRVFPEDKRSLNLWPESPNNFREVIDEYATKIKLMMGVLFKAMAKSLNLEENSFAHQLFGEQALMTARFNFYPRCSRADQVFGVKAHTDGSGLTVLLQDKEVQGLQVLVDGKWARVPIVPHALVVNLGDQMQIMSNGIFKSAMHRVVTNTEKLRLSVAMFNLPAPETEIGPLVSLIHHETRPRLYKNVKNYGRINYKCYQRGEIALETVKM
ncbi:putative codeine 3-O-demethylase [Rosa chinensis]|uniref:Putative codeine 3-O-demethylase n=1 Tax=Rosa chinensis TaxID=74649 RepID=A0A2P6RIL1_ROSCH|nr:protein SRG1 [Rosa chinensis]PRQ46263.1 putative codeine 3-O-demethylase [Rosa chinensis]